MLPLQLQVMSTPFWKKVSELVNLCWPVVELLRDVDSGKPIIGEVRPPSGRLVGQGWLLCMLY